MSKVLKPLAFVAGAALAIPTFGASAAIAGALGVGATIGTLLTGVAAAGLLAFAQSAGGASISGQLSDLDRLNLSQVAAAPRKLVFGQTAFASDLRYSESSGDQQRFVDTIIHLASHKTVSLDAIYINDELAWTVGGGVQGIYAGYLTVEYIAEAGATHYHTVNGGAKWGAAQRMTGCSTVRLRIDRLGASKNVASPFANGLSTNIRFIGKGMPVYDPRRDSTRGGSGSHRADDCSTWAYYDGVTVLGENIALQALSYLLGWRIMGAVSCGLGIDPDRLDMDAFVASANICDEQVAKASGGTHARYWGGNLFPDNQAPSDVLNAFADACNGRWDDSAGALGLHVAINDLSGPLFELTDDDILSGWQWTPFPAAADRFNVVRGTNPDPQAPALYQPTDYPEVRLTSPTGRDRERRLDLALIQDKERPQYIATQVLMRAQYQGELSLRAGIRAWTLDRGEPLRVTLGGLGFEQKLFRCVERQANLDGSVDLVLVEENAAIYPDGGNERAAPTPAVPVVYDPRNAPGARIETVAWGDVVDDGAKPENGATRNQLPGVHEDFSSFADVTAAQQAWWIFGGATLSLETNARYVGGKALRVQGAAEIRGRQKIGYSSEDLYRVRARLRASTIGDGARIYLGVDGLDLAGDRIQPTDGGSSHYPGGTALMTPGEERIFEGYFRGLAAVGMGNGVGVAAPNPSNPSPLASGAVNFWPLVIVQNPPGGTAIVYLDWIEIEKVEDLTPLPSRPWNAVNVQQRGQVVTYLGRSWIARVTNVNVAPPVTATGTATWALLADRGADGAAGAPGRDAVVFWQDTPPVGMQAGDTWLRKTEPYTWQQFDGVAWTPMGGTLGRYDLVVGSLVAANTLLAEKLQLDGVTLSGDGTGKLIIKSNGVGVQQLAPFAAGMKTHFAGGAPLAFNGSLQKVSILGSGDATLTFVNSDLLTGGDIMLHAEFTWTHNDKNTYKFSIYEGATYLTDTGVLSPGADGTDIQTMSFGPFPIAPDSTRSLTLYMQYLGGGSGTGISIARVRFDGEMTRKQT